jgi:hypothetical protein
MEGKTSCKLSRVLLNLPAIFKLRLKDTVQFHALLCRYLSSEKAFLSNIIEKILTNSIYIAIFLSGNENVTHVKLRVRFKA